MPRRTCHFTGAALASYPQQLLLTLKHFLEARVLVAFPEARRRRQKRRRRRRRPSNARELIAGCLPKREIIAEGAGHHRLAAARCRNDVATSRRPANGLVSATILPASILPRAIARRELAAQLPRQQRDALTDFFMRWHACADAAPPAVTPPHSAQGAPPPPASHFKLRRQYTPRFLAADAMHATSFIRRLSFSYRAFDMLGKVDATATARHYHLATLMRCSAAYASGRTAFRLQCAVPHSPAPHITTLRAPPIRALQRQP